ncbi:hypothetical protein KHP57_08200 [Algiphilus sp. NNCM1]|uniref:hypothetical protein n=1 Tax=Algiphilus sp. TaxID=1872431 RepID=UPI001CA61260|nr:hypothetical protein [Algiphilus sp.]MBY8965688.1 hypothetical protein [Algiphilus acroporae]MCI5063789.1 hypothetical protein [Algiphilus sp.]MCI5104130.1 hypothetical protein [Algiphilus sp.]
MHFLCPTHRNALLTESSETITATWFDWMANAGSHYELRRWREAIPYVGCAFDLLAAALRDGIVDPRLGVTKVTLSGIYLAESFTQYGDREKARFALGCTVRRLGPAMHSAAADWAQQCLHTLVDTEQHGAFFRRFMNLPFDEQPRRRVALH